MRLSEPRVAPLRDDEMSAEQRDLLSRGNVARLNIFRTLVRYPELYRKWGAFGAHVLGQSTLPAREREIAILRTGHLCGAEYEVYQHTTIGKLVGLSDEELARIKAGPEAPEWSAFDRALLTAADELHAQQFLSDATWQALSERYETRQMLDLIFTIGQYTLVSMALNSLGVQIERDGVP
ncbi:MAG TPA: carboxymuconolactone decarboxylase family protein [Kofleriaceae bacterium]|nr:carboxymuconolactone decarboxylase family protein [Kofleriaceae bacterium]